MSGSRGEVLALVLVFHARSWYEQGEAGITPDAGIQNLQRRVHKTQSVIDTLEDLTRHNAIPPGALRGE